MAAPIKTDVVIARFNPFTIKKEVPGDSVSLLWSLRNGYPRITVYLTNKKADKVDWNSMIIAPMDYIAAYTIADSIISIANEKEPTRIKVDCKNLKYVDNVKTEEKFVQATVHVGKDEDGIMFLSATETGKPAVKFEIVPTGWVVEYDKDGMELSKAESSKKHAISYGKLLKAMLSTYAINLITTNTTGGDASKKPAYEVESDLF